MKGQGPLFLYFSQVEVCTKAASGDIGVNKRRSKKIMYDNQKSNKINPNRRLGTAHLGQLFFFFFTLAPSLFGANYWIRRHKHHREISRKRKCRIQLFDASGQAVRAEMAYWESGTLGFSPNLSFLSPHLITFFFVLFSCSCILFLFAIQPYPCPTTRATRNRPTPRGLPSTTRKG